MDRIASCSAADLYDAIFQRTRLYRQVQSWFDTCNIVAMPTLSRSAVPIDQDFFGRMKSMAGLSKTSAPPGIPTRCRSISLATRR